LLVKPGEAAGLARRDPAEALGLADKEAAASKAMELTAALTELQGRLWAEGRRAVLLVLQGMDTSGKDGTIRHVFAGVNPQACRVASFKVPTGTELAHDYLWRIHALCPAHGEIGIFNRSHYEDVVVARVKQLVPKDVWRHRFRHIREFERTLSDEGTRVLKVFLHISKDEQRERLQARLDDPTKTWKFRLGDVDDRKLWDDFMDAYEEALTETSTDWAPWHVVPADHKWVRNFAVATLLVDTLRDMDPKLPDPPPELKGLVVR
jgi:PPK2 family polyphosphate:nucleotide phosphotransferase